MRGSAHSQRVVRNKFGVWVPNTGAPIEEWVPRAPKVSSGPSGRWGPTSRPVEKKGSGEKKPESAPISKPAPLRSLSPIKTRGTPQKVKEPAKIKEPAAAPPPTVNPFISPPKEEHVAAPAAPAQSSASSFLPKKAPEPTPDPIPVLRVWKHGDAQAPVWPEDASQYRVLIHDVFQRANAVESEFYWMELNVTTTADGDFYRIYTHYGKMNLLASNPGALARECRFTADKMEARAAYGGLFDEIVAKKTAGQSPYTRVALTTSRVGSARAQLDSQPATTGTSKLPASTQELVATVFAEAQDRLVAALQGSGVAAPSLDAALGGITLQQVEKAEVALFQLAKILRTAGSLTSEGEGFMNDFYNAVPHALRARLDTVNMIETKQELLQLMKDVLSVSEVAGAATVEGLAAVDVQYRALNCTVEPVAPGTADYASVLDLVTCPSIATVRGVFRVTRPDEDEAVLQRVRNRRLLFHGSRMTNWMGILKRGILPPANLVSQFGESHRRDAGKLGLGIYFGDKPETAIKYATPNARGTRFMLLADVALGTSHTVTLADPSIRAPPPGCHSLHGAPAAKGDFTEDEYAVYDVRQQRVRYLVEYVLAGDPSVPAVPVAAPADKTPAGGSGNPKPKAARVEPARGKEAEVELGAAPVDAAIPLNEPVGLLTTNEAGETVALPLIGVRVFARIVDLVGEVVVFQGYMNKSSSPMEARYVFPLDESCAVCGFEAFIGDKHVVGVVKEKEQARREYKKAVEEGHGAYLMEQEKPDLFSVTVGNLPPETLCAIKITYVCELPIDGRDIVFRIPAHVAPSKAKQAAEERVLQGVTASQQVETDETSVAIDISLDMPYDIVKLETPGHTTLTKRTATMATICLPSQPTLHADFLMLIELERPHEPRMWVEEDPDDPGNPACLLAFYPALPEAEERVHAGGEVVFLVDRSASMRGAPAEDMRATLRACLAALPATCRFNVVSYGSSHQRAFGDSRAPTPLNRRAALRSVLNEADLGGTDLFAPLASVLALAGPGGVSVVVISDGQHSAEDRVAALAAQHRRSAHIFTIGVGSAPAQHVLSALAYAGGGRGVLMASPFAGSRLKNEARLARQMKRALQATLQDIKVTWAQTSSRAAPPVQAPQRIESVFGAERQLVYGFVDFCAKASLEAVLGEYKFSTAVDARPATASRGKILHRLAARSIVREFEDGIYSDDRVEHTITKKSKEAYITSLGIKYGLVTPFTSFIAVEERHEGEGPQPPLDLEAILKAEAVDQLTYMGWEGPPAAQAALRRALGQPEPEVIEDEKKSSERGHHRPSAGWDDGDAGETSEELWSQREMIRRQDEALDALLASVSNMKEIASAIGSELESQTMLLTDFDEASMDQSKRQTDTWESLDALEGESLAPPPPPSDEPMSPRQAAVPAGVNYQRQSSPIAVADAEDPFAGAEAAASPSSRRRRQKKARHSRRNEADGDEDEAMPSTPPAMSPRRSAPPPEPVGRRGEKSGLMDHSAPPVSLHSHSIHTTPAPAPAAHATKNPFAADDDGVASIGTLSLGMGGMGGGVSGMGIGGMGMGAMGPGGAGMAANYGGLPMTAALPMPGMPVGYPPMNMPVPSPAPAPIVEAPYMMASMAPMAQKPSMAPMPNADAFFAPTPTPAPVSAAPAPASDAPSDSRSESTGSFKRKLGIKRERSDVKDDAWMAQAESAAAAAASAAHQELAQAQAQAQAESKERQAYAQERAAQERAAREMAHVHAEAERKSGGISGAMKMRINQEQEERARVEQEYRAHAKEEEAAARAAYKAAEEQAYVERARKEERMKERASPPDKLVRNTSRASQSLLSKTASLFADAEPEPEPAPMPEVASRDDNKRFAVKQDAPRRGLIGKKKGGEGSAGRAGGADLLSLADSKDVDNSFASESAYGGDWGERESAIVYEETADLLSQVVNEAPVEINLRGLADAAPPRKPMPTRVVRFADRLIPRMENDGFPLESVLEVQAFPRAAFDDWVRSSGAYSMGEEVVGKVHSILANALAVVCMVLQGLSEEHRQVLENVLMFMDVFVQENRGLCADLRFGRSTWLAVAAAAVVERRLVPDLPPHLSAFDAHQRVMVAVGNRQL